VVEVEGDTEIETPVPTAVPPHEAVYQAYEAPVPKVPPAAVNVVEAPSQIVDVPVIDEGATLDVFTVTS
jgi:hypothetical protein